MINHSSIPTIKRRTYDAKNDFIPKRPDDGKNGPSPPYQAKNSKEKRKDP